MKKGMIWGSLFLAWAAFAGTGFAGDNHLTGTLVKIDGAMYTVKDSMDKEHTIHVDPKSTKKKGDLKPGVMVKAEVDANGHAISIKVVEMEEGKDMMQNMMKDDKGMMDDK